MKQITDQLKKEVFEYHSDLHKNDRGFGGSISKRVRERFNLSSEEVRAIIKEMSNPPVPVEPTPGTLPEGFTKEVLAVCDKCGRDILNDEVALNRDGIYCYDCCQIMWGMKEENKKAGFTSGEWKILKGNGTHFATINKDVMTRICTIDIGDIGDKNSGFAPIEEAEANARLIASAPAMLEALKELADKIDLICFDGQYPFTGQIEKAKAAIQSATK